jgi:hypothetical protein
VARRDPDVAGDDPSLLFKRARQCLTGFEHLLPSVDDDWQGIRVRCIG